MTTSWRFDGAVGSAAQARRVDATLADGSDERLFRRRVEFARQRAIELMTEAVAAVIDDLVAICLFRVYLGHQELEPAHVESIVGRALDGGLVEPDQP